MNKKKNYFADKGIGAYFSFITFVLILVALIYYILDANQRNSMSIVIIICFVVAIILEAMVIVNVFLKKNLDEFEVLPILSGVFSAVAFTLYLKGTVDVLGYIFTGHYSFSNDYPYMGISMLLAMIGIMFNVIAGFLKQKKGPKIDTRMEREYESKTQTEKHF